MSRHTPGEWRAHTGNVNDCIDIDGDGGVTRITTVHLDVSDIAFECFPNDRCPDFMSEIAERWANAHLIAAAPDLLAALENLVSRDLIKDKDNDHYDEVLEAIAKAKGGKV